MRSLTAVIDDVQRAVNEFTNDFLAVLTITGGALTSQSTAPLVPAPRVGTVAVQVWPLMAPLVLSPRVGAVTVHVWPHMASLVPSPRVGAVAVQVWPPMAPHVPSPRVGAVAVQVWPLMASHVPSPRVTAVAVLLVRSVVPWCGQTSRFFLYHDEHRCTCICTNARTKRLLRSTDVLVFVLMRGQNGC